MLKHMCLWCTHTFQTKIHCFRLFYRLYGRKPARFLKISKSGWVGGGRKIRVLLGFLRAVKSFLINSFLSDQKLAEFRCSRVFFKLSALFRLISATFGRFFESSFFAVLSLTSHHTRVCSDLSKVQ